MSAAIVDEYPHLYPPPRLGSLDLIGPTAPVR